MALLGSLRKNARHLHRAGALICLRLCAPDLLGDLNRCQVAQGTVTAHIVLLAMIAGAPAVLTKSEVIGRALERLIQ